MAAGTWRKLLDTPGDVSRATLAIEATIAKSFETHPMRHMTKAEVTRRFDMCASIFEKLVGHERWGLLRALDHLSEYLKAELDGVPWTPDARSCWVPEDGAMQTH
jgi:hypothetical protein